MVASLWPKTGRQWSLLLAGIAVARAASYHFRPPRPTDTTEILTGELSYEAWAVLLTAGAALVTIGMWRRCGSEWEWWLAFVGHMGLALTYLTFTLSIGWAALCYGEPWAGFAPIALVFLLHAKRVKSIGSEIGRR